MTGGTTLYDLSQLRLDSYERIRQDMGDAGVVGLCVSLPNLLFQQRQPTEGAMYDYYDHHDLLADFMAEWTDYLERLARAIVAQPVKPDFVFFPNSGLLTMQSLDIVKEFSLPAMARLTRIHGRVGYLHFTARIAPHGTFNFLLGNGQALWAHASTSLYYVERKHPFAHATLSDEDLSVNFAEHTQPTDRVAVVVTAPLTTNEHWVAFVPGELKVFVGGALHP